MIIIILILHLSVCASVCESVCDVRAGGHGKPFDPSQKNISFSSSLDLDDT